MSGAADEDEVHRTALEIEAYLRGRPDAADTLKGVVSAWLSKVRLEAAEATVLRALDYLERAGIVEKRLLQSAGAPARSRGDAPAGGLGTAENYLYRCRRARPA